MKKCISPKKFFIIGENFHTTRIVLRRGKHVTEDPDGDESIKFIDLEDEINYLKIPDKVKRSQDYEEGRVKHVAIAVRTAMAQEGPEAIIAMKYLSQIIGRQVNAGADFLDINMDEISIKPDEQQEAMEWSVKIIQNKSSLPLSVDSSNIETIEVGLKICAGSSTETMLNSASLERIEALGLAKDYGSRVIVTAAGNEGMPQNTSERVDFGSRMVDAAIKEGIPLDYIYIDPLVFPISVDSQFGNHCFSAISELRKKYGEEIHITGGFSNVSFGLPARRLINNVFMVLAVEAGADSGIIDPLHSNPVKVLSMNREDPAVHLAEEMLLGRDEFCANFIAAYRKGELDGIV